MSLCSCGLVATSLLPYIASLPAHTYIPRLSFVYMLAYDVIAAPRSFLFCGPNALVYTLLCLSYAACAFCMPAATGFSSSRIYYSASAAPACMVHTITFFAMPLRAPFMPSLCACLMPFMPSPARARRRRAAYRRILWIHLLVPYRARLHRTSALLWRLPNNIYIWQNNVTRVCCAATYMVPFLFSTTSYLTVHLYYHSYLL